MRRRLLVFLLLSALVLTLAESVVVYFIALTYAGHVADADLLESVDALGRALVDGRSDGRLSVEAQRLIEFDSDGRILYAVTSAKHGLLSGERKLVEAVSADGMSGPALQDASVSGELFRIASSTIAAPRDPGDRLRLLIAEPLGGRSARALEVGLLMTPVETAATALLAMLTWWGVRFGLQALDPPTRRLERSDRELAPISGPDIPVEILPLTSTIDALFERIRGLMALQEQFVADAAHQLRTPLAGLSLHVERALARNVSSETRTELEYLRTLITRMARSTQQLLALARVQAPAALEVEMPPLDLVQWLPDVVASKVPQALEAGVDLGYEVELAFAVINADRGMLVQLFDNLIDNALIHAGTGGVVNISAWLEDAGASVAIAVDDSGHGVPSELLPRLGERFFRAPAAPGGGSGLGLAIVRRIADVHHASLQFGPSRLGGLRIELRFQGMEVRQ